MATERKHISNPRSEEGRRLLYRLLLVAVAVVYALVFVLDYLLQLHFTFFLLLSLFGFVILTLFYMWIKVSGMDEPADDAEPETAEGDQPEPLEPDLDVFGDAVFLVNPASGLTTDCSEAAVRLFGASGKNDLLGADLNSLMADDWTEEDIRTIRFSLQRTGSAAATANYLSLDGRKFKALLQVRKSETGNGNTLIVRITDLTGLPESVAAPSAETGSTDDRNLIPFTALFEEGYSPMAMIGMNYKFVRANRAFCDLLGYLEHELQQLSYLDIVHPDERKQEQKNISLVFSGEQPVSRRERRFIKRNNDLIWVNTTSSLGKDQQGRPQFVVSMAENITHRKRIERSMADKRQKLTTLVENAEYGILSVDRHHTILLINSKLCDVLFAMTGIVVETGFNVLDILPEQFHQEYLELHKKAFAGERSVTERRLLLSGKRRDLEIVVTPVKNDSDTVTSVSFFGKDITERKLAEQQLIEEKEKAETATQLKSSFLATMSHEIRTPLNGVIGMGKLLNQTSLNPKQQEYVDSILLSGDALLSVINDILDYSKIESSKMELENKPFAPRRCIVETYDLLSSKAIEKKLSLQYSIARDVPRYIFGDITRLRQILMNLVSNAIKFTASGKITVALSRVQTVNDKTELLFEVKDTGIGIPADRIHRLFETFSQVDSATARTYGGTGLGLAICKNLVELMGGKIWVESVEGKGSNFQFTILCRVAGADDVPRVVPNGTTKLANSHVLLICDDKTEADVYANYFRRWNMVPEVSQDISQAISAVNSRKDYNLVLIDAQMISTKGLQLASRIRALRTKDELPIVLFNADPSGDIQFDYTGDVVSAVIPKNVDRSKVLDILIGVFSVEQHQRSQHEEDLKRSGRKLGDEIPVRIMIAEDNHINQKLAQNIFEGLGYKPVIVSNGLEVIEALRKTMVDIIFMDVQMPEMDGLETTRFIHQKMDLEKRPVIVAMTAFALEGDKEKCLEAGMDDYISKPFMIEEIIERIRKWGDRYLSIQSEVKKNQTMTTDVIINEPVLGRLKEMTSVADPNFFLEVIRMFITQGEEIVKEIQEKCKSGDWKSMSQLAHKLKGSALNIGANRLAGILREIETGGRDGIADLCEENNKLLDAGFNETIAELKRLTGA